MAQRNVVSVQQGGKIVGWVVLTDASNRKIPLMSQLFATEAEAHAERLRLNAQDGSSGKPN